MKLRSKFPSHEAVFPNARTWVSFLPGTFFAVSNFGQTAALSWPLPASPPLVFLSFLVLFNLMAPALLVGHHLLGSLRKPVRLPIVAVFALCAAVLHLLAISVLIAWIRAPQEFDLALPLYAGEILVTCIPVWLGVFATVLFVFNRLDRGAIDEESEQGGADRFELQAEGRTFFLQPAEIFYAQAQGNYLKLVTAYEEMLVRMPLSALEKRLPSSLFTRVHRGALISNEQILSLSTTATGAHRARLRCGAELPVSRTILAQLRARLH